MTLDPRPAPEQIGTCHGTRIDIVARDAVDAEVSLAIAGMFTHELGSAPPTGGLRHLDQVLDGAINELRSQGIMTGAAGETLLLTTAHPRIRAATLLVVGLGAPEAWSPAVMRDAVARSVGEALRLGVSSAAFAPGLLDSGLAAADVTGTPTAMLAGLLDGIGNGSAVTLERWQFCAGLTHFEQTARVFRIALAALTGA